MMTFSIYGPIGLAVLSLALLYFHLRRRKEIGNSERRGVPIALLGVLMVYMAAAFVMYRGATLPVFTFVSTIISYGILLFITISTFLLSGLGQWLTNTRGKNWVKEIDYVYLLLGFVGVMGAINRLEVLSDRLAGGDLVAPVILTTAIVFRVIKTRAEIAGWNKDSFYKSPTTY